VELESKLQILTGLYGPAKASPDMLDRLQTLNNILLRQFPENALVNGIQGDIFQLAENPDSSIHYYRKSLAIDPTNEQVWQEILLVESETEDYKTLQKDAEKALEYFPNRVPFLYFYGLGSQQTGNYDEAIYAFDKLRKSAAGDPELTLQAYISLGEVYQLNQNYTKSEESFEKALELDPQNAFVLNNFAYYLSLRKEKLDKAAEMVQKALSQNPNSSAYLDTYGWILYLQGNYQKAAEYMERAVNQGGTGEVLEHYGDVLAKLGQSEKAEEYWKKAKETGQENLDLEQKRKENNLK
jgi:Tfp pilus assembly protein PilF